MTTPDEYQFKILVPGSNAKGALYEATAETTLTGVLWTLRGNLAKGVQALIESASSVGSDPAMKRERTALELEYRLFNGAWPEEDGLDWSEGKP